MKRNASGTENPSLSTLTTIQRVKMAIEKTVFLDTSTFVEREALGIGDQTGSPDRTK